MKVDKTVARETGYIALCVLIGSALMESVFLMIGKWDLSVLFGNLLSAALALVNFFVMGLTVQKSLGADGKKASQMMKLSHTIRMVVLFAVVAWAVCQSFFNLLAVLIPLFFPRVAIMLRPHFQMAGQ